MRMVIQNLANKYNTLSINPSYGNIEPRKDFCMGKRGNVENSEKSCKKYYFKES